MQALYHELITALSSEVRNLAPSFADFSSRSARELVRISPVKTLSVSLTGQNCQQNCAHCNGHYLKGMQNFNELAKRDLHDYDAILISGGGLESGAVPITEHLTQLIALPVHLQMNLHPGYQPVAPLLPLKARKPVISFDLPGTDKVISNVYKLHYQVSDYQKLFISYNQHFTTIAHICIGIDCGTNSGEEKTIDFLATQKPDRIVFIIFRPTPGTEFAGCNPPTLARTAEVIGYAKTRLDCEIMLGCMRPAGIYRRDSDIIAWLHGIDKIVQPHHKLTEILTRHGITIAEHKNCCALTH